MNMFDTNTWINILDNLTRKELVFLFSISKEFYQICVLTLKQQLQQRQPFRKNINSFSIRDLQLSSRTSTCNRLMIMNIDFTKVIKEIIEVDDVIFATRNYCKSNFYFLLDKDYYLHYGNPNSFKKIKLTEIENKNINSFTYQKLYFKQRILSFYNYPSNFIYDYDKKKDIFSLRRITNNVHFYPSIIMNKNISAQDLKNISVRYYRGEYLLFVLFKNNILKVYQVEKLFEEYEYVNNFYVSFMDNNVFIIFNNGKCIERNYKNETTTKILENYFVRDIQYSFPNYFVFTA